MTSHRHAPTTPMVAESAFRSAALFQFDTTGEDQEPVRMVVHFGDPAVRSAWARGLADTRARERAWAENPACVECNQPIPTAGVAGLLSLPEGLRVAHKTPCWLKQLAAMRSDIRLGGQR